MQGLRLVLLYQFIATDTAPPLQPHFHLLQVDKVVLSHTQPAAHNIDFAFRKVPCPPKAPSHLIESNNVVTLQLIEALRLSLLFNEFHDSFNLVLSQAREAFLLRILKFLDTLSLFCK